MRQYPLLHNGIEVGTVSVFREGLYCRIICVCHEEQLCGYRVVVTTQKACVDLGKCTKDSDKCALCRFIPAKVLGSGELLFSINDMYQTTTHLVPLDPSKPFPNIAQLPRGRFVKDRSRCGVVMDNHR